MTREEAWNRIDAMIEQHEIDDIYVTITNVSDYDALRYARKALKQEQKVGHWFDCKDKDGIWITTCLECGEETRTLWNYCPHCGIKMGGCYELSFGV